jgi:hypothetical protein
MNDTGELTGRLWRSRERRRLPCVGEGPEERRRREDGGGDRDALGDGLGGVADGVEVGEDPGARGVDVVRHLGDALGVVRDRAEGVHGDDDADRGEQATTGQGDEEQRQRGGPPPRVKAP